MHILTIPAAELAEAAQSMPLAEFACASLWTLHPANRTLGWMLKEGGDLEVVYAGPRCVDYEDYHLDPEPFGVVVDDLAAWEWDPQWGPQPLDQHVRHQLHVVEPRTREWAAEQDAAFVAAMEAEQARDRAYVDSFS